MRLTICRIPNRLLRKHLVLLTAACAVFWMVAMVAMVANAAPAPASADLEITKFAFTPKEVTVAPGTKVTWVNRDEAPHTVTSNDKSFASKGLDTDDKYERTFDQEGDFAYFCSVHPFMTGIVHVHKP